MKFLGDQMAFNNILRIIIRSRDKQKLT